MRRKHGPNFWISFTAPALLAIATATAHAQTGLAPFTEEAAIRGIAYQPDLRDAFGTGVAFVDLDNDRDPDLICLGKTWSNQFQPYTVALYENDGTGNFTNRSANSGIPIMPAACGVVAGDYDGDGDLDLYFSCWLAPDHLLRNDGNFQFTDVTEHFGMGSPGAGQGAGWGDFDNDGWLDLYVTNRTGTNFPDPPFPISPVQNLLYHNLDGEIFEEIGFGAGVAAADDPSFQGSFFDYDRDGDADLYLSNDKGLSRGCAVRNRMWENRDGRFVDISQSSGTNGCIDAMCIAFGDYDGNGFLDIYVTNLPLQHYLYANNGDGTFVDRAEQLGVASYKVGWGSAFLDFDNDGRLDIYVCQHGDPNRLYLNTGPASPAIDVAPELGCDDPDESFTLATADIDNDGDLDIAVCNRRKSTGQFGKIQLFINNEGQNRNWTKLHIVGSGGNTFAIGALVDIATQESVQVREVVAGTGFKGQDDLTVHAGLGEQTVIDSIQVRWPNGQTRTVTNYAANNTWTILPPEMLGDKDQSGQIEVQELMDMFACFFEQGGTMRPGCEAFDFDGDGKFTSTDFFDFLAAFFSQSIPGS